MKPGKTFRALWNRNRFIVCVVGFTLIVAASCAAPAAMEMPEDEPASPPQETHSTEAAAIPEKLAAGLISETLKVEELVDLKEKLESIIHFLTKKKQN